jgi:hypothetical protein
MTLPASAATFRRIRNSKAEADPALLPVEIAGLVPIRSLYADCTAAKALTVLAATPLPGSTDAPAVEAIADNYVYLTSGPVRLLVAVQIMGAEKIALHILTNEGGPVAALARYAQALRLILETPVAEAA